MTIYHYMNDRMKGIPNFVSIIGIWMNYKLVGMIVYIYMCQFIRSDIRKATPSDIKDHITLNTIFSAAFWTSGNGWMCCIHILTYVSLSFLTSTGYN